MSWFRSAEMAEISIIIQEHVARDCIERLGVLGGMQFVDVSGTDCVCCCA